jgi:cobalt-zinc-cadmium efflux system protein
LTRSRRLWIAFALNLALVAGQVVFGLAANSLGLLADAGHNLTDVAALVIALIAVRLSQRPPTPTYSYGYHRSTILAALVNAAALLAVTSFIAFEAITRLLRPQSVNGGIVLVVASAATLLNVGAALVLYERRVDLNMRAALLHMAGDAAASLGVAVAGLVILITGGFEWLDPVVSIGIAVSIAIEAWRLLHAAVDVLLESTPDDVDLSMLRAAVTEVDGVVDLHDLHVWSLSSGVRAMSAHVVVDGHPSLDQSEAVGMHVKELLGTRFTIAHATLEFHTIDGWSSCVSDVERHVGD